LQLKRILTAIAAALALAVGGGMLAAPAQAADHHINTFCSVWNSSGLSGYTYATRKTVIIDVICPGNTNFKVSSIGTPKFSGAGGSVGVTTTHFYTYSGTHRFYVTVTPDKFGRRMNWYIYLTAYHYTYCSCGGSQTDVYTHGYYTYYIGLNQAAHPSFTQTEPPAEGQCDALSDPDTGVVTPC
jgi:hypothetical protein